MGTAPYIYIFISPQMVLYPIPYRLPGNWTFRSQDHSLPGAKVPGVELSIPGTFVPWNFRTLGLSFLRTGAKESKTKVQVNICL